MAISSTNKKFHEILALLGIDVEGTTKIVITAEVNEAVRVDITRWVVTKDDQAMPKEQVFHLLPVANDVEDKINTETKSGK